MLDDIECLRRANSKWQTNKKSILYRNNKKRNTFLLLNMVKTSAKHLFYAMFVIKLRTSLKQHKCHQ